MTLQSAGGNVTPVDDIGARIRELAPWFHNLRLPSGHETAPDHPLGPDFPRFKWEEIAPHLPDDLSGWRALDIGCNAGFYCFELARRGATVLGIDHDEHYLEQARWVAPLYGLADRVEFRRMTVYDLHSLDTTFDLVLFLGVLYHLRYPMLGLDLVAEKVGRLLVLQTLQVPGEEVVDPPEDVGIDERERLREPGWPHLAFIENKLAGDTTNWWAPNHAATVAMLRAAGLRVAARPGHEIYVCEPEAESWRQAEARRELGAALGRGRARS